MMWGYGWNGGGGLGIAGAFIMMLIGLIILIGIILLIVWAVRQGEHRHPGGYGYGGHPGEHPQQPGQEWRPAQPGTMTPAGHAPATGRDPAVDAARERYARGEITKEQLDQIMKDLGY